MILNMLILPLIITMLGGNHNAQRPVRAPIIISHVIEGKNTCHFQQDPQAPLDHNMLVIDQDVVLINIPQHTREIQSDFDAIPVGLQKEVVPEKSTPMAEGNTSWLNFLDVKTIEIFTSQIPGKFHLSIDRACSNLEPLRISLISKKTTNQVPHKPYFW